MPCDPIPPRRFAVLVWCWCEQVSPPYDVSDTTSLQALRLIVEMMGSVVAHGKMGAHKSIIDKEFVAF